MILAQAIVIPPVRAYVETMRVRWWLARGDQAKANERAAHLIEAIKTVQRPGEDTEIYAITAARVWIMGGSRSDAWNLLYALETRARAVESLEEALNYAHPEGYRRVFLDEGQPMQRLLAQWLAHARNEATREFAIHLLSQFDTELRPNMVADQSKKAPSFVSGDLHERTVLAESETQSDRNMLLEPLSQRELEVLHLMALGCTNQAIAQQLVVAPGTIKAHAASIYRKLDTANRTEAVARARQLGLLP